MSNTILNKDNILLNAKPGNKVEAIELTGNILVEKGYASKEYINKMKEREELTSTYMGNFVAIPHGTEDSKKEVHHSGISIVQAPEGVDFDGNEVKVLIGIAGKNDEHLEILSQIAVVCSETDNIEKMVSATTAEELLELFEEIG
ncbi:PTS sugar transporter subunit IIA [Alteribacter populi]|uniref:PTS sugar transporter subunit IIA n=1 Tax=Alteribacter populi TaxID=2011011 RepID=UPI000BBB3A59|nr:PTS sugar transporter subunit IIA [Alteribacter populi]